MMVFLICAKLRFWVGFGILHHSTWCLWAHMWGYIPSCVLKNIYISVSFSYDFVAFLCVWSCFKGWFQLWGERTQKWVHLIFTLLRSPLLVFTNFWFIFLLYSSVFVCRGRVLGKRKKDQCRTRSGQEFSHSNWPKTQDATRGPSWPNHLTSTPVFIGPTYRTRCFWRIVWLAGRDL